MSFKDPGNTFDISPKWERTLPFVVNFSWDIYRVPQENPNINVDIWHPAVRLRFRYPPRHLRQISPAKYLWSKSEVRKDLAVWCQFFMDIHRVPLKRNQNTKVVTPCCELEVQKFTKALKSVKVSGNTFDLSLKWERTLPSAANFAWDIYRVPQNKSTYQSWYVTPAVGLGCRYLPTHLRQLTARAISLI